LGPSSEDYLFFPKELRITAFARTHYYFDQALVSGEFATCHVSGEFGDPRILIELGEMKYDR
jgi:hypothetical protein